MNITPDSVIPTFFWEPFYISYVFCRYLWYKIKCLVSITFERQCFCMVQIIGLSNGTCTILIWHLLLTLYVATQLFSSRKWENNNTEHLTWCLHQTCKLLYTMVFILLSSLYCWDRHKCFPLMDEERQALINVSDIILLTALNSRLSHHSAQKTLPNQSPGTQDCLSKLWHIHPMDN